MEPSKETKESRARRGKVGHLRSDPPFAHVTACGVDATIGGRVVNREAFDCLVAEGTACKNCLRASKRVQG